MPLTRHSPGPDGDPNGCGTVLAVGVSAVSSTAPSSLASCREWTFRHGPVAVFAVPTHAVTGWPSASQLKILVWPSTANILGEPGDRTRTTGFRHPAAMRFWNRCSFSLSAAAADHSVSPLVLSICVSGTRVGPDQARSSTQDRAPGG